MKELKKERMKKEEKKKEEAKERRKWFLVNAILSPSLILSHLFFLSIVSFSSSFLNHHLFIFHIQHKFAVLPSTPTQIKKRLPLQELISRSTEFEEAILIAS